MKRYGLLFGLKLIRLLVLSNISFKKCHSAYSKEQRPKKEIQSTVSIEQDPIAQCCQISEQHQQRNMYQKRKGNRDNTTAQSTYMNYFRLLALVERGRRKFYENKAHSFLCFLTSKSSSQTDLPFSHSFD